jgi:hypothetical protein
VIGQSLRAQSSTNLMSVSADRGGRASQGSWQMINKHRSYALLALQRQAASFPQEVSSELLNDMM